MFGEEEESASSGKQYEGTGQRMRLSTSSR